MVVILIQNHFTWYISSKHHEKMKELQKAFEIAKQLLQQHVDEKQHVSQDDPDRCSKYSS